MDKSFKNGFEKTAFEGAGAAVGAPLGVAGGALLLNAINPSTRPANILFPLIGGGVGAALGEKIQNKDGAEMAPVAAGSILGSIGGGALGASLGGKSKQLGIASLLAGILGGGSLGGLISSMLVQKAKKQENNENR